MTPEQKTLLLEASRLCTEIGLRTYGRKGDELVATETWQKLQKAEAMVREIRAIIQFIKNQEVSEKKIFTRLH